MAVYPAEGAETPDVAGLTTAGFGQKLRSPTD
jgi:hypothetical protein